MLKIPKYIKEFVNATVSGYPKELQKMLFDNANKIINKRIRGLITEYETMHCLFIYFESLRGKNLDDMLQEYNKNNLQF